MLKAKPLLALFLMLSLLILLSTSHVFAANSKVTMIKPTSYATQNLDQAKVIRLVEKTFGLNTPNSKYKEAKVKIISPNYGSSLGYLVVYLPHTNSYVFDTVKIELNRDYTVKNYIKNYKEQASDYANYKHHKPNYPHNRYDENVDAVFVTAVDDVPTAVQGVNQAANTARAAGYNVKVLIGDEATVDACKYWLSQPNVKVFGNIGHGANSGIMLKDGMLSNNEFSEMGLENKVLYFNSCQTFNDPLKSSIIDSAKVQKFVGGIPDLLIGPSEEVFKAFWKKTLSEKKGMTQSLKDAEVSTRYPEPGAHGIGGNGADFVNRPGNNPNPNPEPNPSSDTTVSVGTTSSYTLNVNIPANSAATSLIVYANNTPVKTISLTPNLPQAQTIVLHSTNAAVGTFTYRLELKSATGVISANTVSVTLKAAETPIYGSKAQHYNIK